MVNGWDGVDLGEIPELNRVSKFRLRFEDVTLTTSGYAVLAGSGYDGWWVGAYVYSGQTVLTFNVGGWQDVDWMRTFQSETSIRINDGGRTDWDPMAAVLGPVSFCVPEPASLCLLVALGGFFLRRRH